jgi:putative transposase
MGDAYISILVHCAFSTKQRCGLIPAELQPQLWAYIGGIARQHGMRALAVGGTENHAHVLLSLPAVIPVAKAVQEIKACSSKWLREAHGRRAFAWQAGYGAFSIGARQIEAPTTYICRQAEHHRRRDFQAEFILFLKRNGVEYDPRFLWG